MAFSDFRQLQQGALPPPNKAPRDVGAQTPAGLERSDTQARGIRDEP